MGLASEEGLHGLDHFWHARHAANQHHIIDLGRRQAGVIECRLAGADGALDEAIDQRLQLGPGELHGEMLRSGGVRRDEGEVDLGLCSTGKLDLGLLGGLAQALHRELVAAQVDAGLLFELVRQVVDNTQVEVLPAEEGVAVGRLHLKDAVADLEDGDVEGAAAQVIDRDHARAALLEPVSERGSGRLVDNAQHLEPGDLAGVLSRLALGIVEIGGNRDYRFADRLAEIALGGLLHLLQHHGADLARGVALAARLDPGIAVVRLDNLVGDHVGVLFRHRVFEVAPDKALDGEKGVFRVGHALAFGRLADQTLVLGEGYHRRCGPGAFGVLDHLGFLAFHDGNAGVRGAKVDTDDLAHIFSLSKSRRICSGLVEHRTARSY